jgi:hypothetical protein
MVSSQNGTPASDSCGEDLGPGYSCERIPKHGGDCEPFPCPEDRDSTQGGAS